MVLGKQNDIIPHPLAPIPAVFGARRAGEMPVLHGEDVSHPSYPHDELNMIELPHHLLLNEQKAMTAFANYLSEQMAGNLAHLYLFGSKARGDFQPDSDIDLLVIVRELTPDARWLIRAAAVDYLLQYEVLLNTHILDQAHWDKITQYQDTLWREVDRDGVPILVPAASTLVH